MQFFKTILFLSCFDVFGVARAETNDFGVGIKDQSTFEVAINKFADSQVEIWWLKPVNSRWDAYKAISMQNEKKKRIIDLIKTAKYGENNDNYNLIDLPFQESERRGQGILVMREKSGGYLAFRMRAGRTVRGGLGIVRVTRFDPNAPDIKWTNSANERGLDGIVLREDLQTVISEIDTANKHQ